MPKSATTPNAARPRPRKSTRKREEQVPMVCASAPQGHEDLLGKSGVLTIDRDGKVIHTVTFDPDDQAMPNAIIPVIASKTTGETFAVRAPEGRWSFTADWSMDDEADEAGEIADATETAAPKGRGNLRLLPPPSAE